MGLGWSYRQGFTDSFEAMLFVSTYLLTSYALAAAETVSALFEEWYSSY